jgi:hypothetical protein
MPGVLISAPLSFGYAFRLPCLSDWAVNFSGTVATFTDGNFGATSADFTAIIVWDDNTANYGTVSSAGAGTSSFTVSGTHTFATFHTLHTITVTILDQGGSSARAR